MSTLYAMPCEASRSSRDREYLPQPSGGPWRQCSLKSQRKWGLAMLNEASRLAEMGYRVFPCRPGEKIPATTHGCKDATCDIEQVGTWWDDQPGANVGISTDGLLVLDVDVTDGQPNPWLAPELACEMNTVAGAVSRTPRGGWHYWFCAPDNSDLRNTAGKITPGIDTRANGGYVVGPPSVTSVGAYSWVPGHELDCPPESLPEPPGWLLRALNATDKGKPSPQPKSSPDTHYGNGAEPIADGKRNATLASIGRGTPQAGLESACH